MNTFGGICGVVFALTLVALGYSLGVLWAWLFDGGDDDDDTPPWVSA